MAQRTMREIWETSRGYLQLMVTEFAYDIYLKPLRPVSWENGVLTLAAPTEREREWCEVRMNRMIERELRLEAGRPVRVVYVLAEPGSAAAPVSSPARAVIGMSRDGGNHAE